MDLLERFRKTAVLENQDRSKKGWRYSDSLKSLAVEYVRVRRQEGSTWSDISEELGVSVLTLGRWEETVEPVRFHPVAVTGSTEETRQSLIVVTPSGLRIEGLVLSQVLELERHFR